MGCKVWGARYGVQGMGCKVWGARYGVQGMGCKVWGARYGVQGMGCKQNNATRSLKLNFKIFNISLRCQFVTLVSEVACPGIVSLVTLSCVCTRGKRVWLTLHHDFVFHMP